ncbi:MAG: ABC transporter permease [Pyrinomonadaceae bacterium]|nr:ABC transporter permease [Pyrinomonadaceae bacterium]
MNTLWQDLRYGVRMLAKNPGFTFIAVLALALGIGANAAIFSVVNAVLLRPLPFEHSERLVRVWGTNVKKNLERRSSSFLNFTDWQKQNHVFESMTAYTGAAATLTSEGSAPEQLGGIGFTGDLFAVSGAQPALGRTFAPEELAASAEGAPIVVVISNDLWRRRFSSDPNITGKQLTLDANKSATVIGVMPADFKFPVDFSNVDFWLPLDPTDELNAERDTNYLQIVGRLKPNVSLTQAQAEMNTITARLEQEYPEENAGRTVSLVSLHESLVGNVRPALLVLLGAVGLVLLIACANVANLLLARAATRSREIAIRTALGARRARVVRQLLTESALLSLAGGALGLLLALWGIDLLVAAIPFDVARLGEVNLDARVIAFTLGVSVLTGVAFGLAPALQASRVDLNETLKEGGRGGTESLRRNRVRSLLVVSEIALSLVLLIGAGLLIKSFWHLREINPGFDPNNVITATLSLSGKYEEESQQAEFFQRAVGRISALPGVEAAGAIFPLPLSGNAVQGDFEIEGNAPLGAGEKPNANFRMITPDLLRAMGIPLVKGRAFSERDNEDAPKVLLINETLARRFFASTDPLGKHLKFSTLSGETTGEIVGVVGDVRFRGLDAGAEPEYYMSYLQFPMSEMSLVARTAFAEPTTLVPAMRNAVLDIDKDQPLYETKAMNQLIGESIAERRFNMLLLGSFAFVALTLAAIGIFGVMSYSVAQRTHEIGIRMALGAQGRDVARLVIGQGMILVLIGVAIGLAGALALTGLMKSLLYGVSATDPITFAGIALLLTAVAFLACYIPARRATKVDPLVALRYE